MHRKLQLHHHKHSGKLIHHRHTSYWALVLLMFVSAASMMLLERAANADDMVVTATVPAPIPSGKPVILSPANNSTITDPGSVALSGTCPTITPAIIVAIYRNTELLGSGLCLGSGTFSVSVSLQAGTQILQARVVTITGQYGETSDDYTITYSPPPTVIPVIPEEPPTTPSTPDVVTPTTYPPFTQPSISDQSLPIVIHFEPPVLTYRPNFPTALNATIAGGTGPYTVRINWGDGKSSLSSIDSNGNLRGSHTYESGDVTTFSITVTDARGQSVTRWYAVANIGPKAAPIHFGASTLIDRISEHIITIPVLLYVLLLLSLLTLWRYERTHYRQRIGIPMHYHWQHKNRHK